ncbi:MAG: hypothetical protein EOO60_13490 [Hymenobacter sp.]|nr:MAG: hypothetical protein EOO60_13490 [Hymenobacter sp.]
MVTPVSPPLSLDYLAIYQSVLHRAIDVFAAIIELYQPDIHAPRDWADITVSEATSQQRELGLRLLRTEIKAANSITLASTLSHYLDTHWADYERVLTPNPAKRQQVERFHAMLEALTKELSPVTIALRQQEQAR